MGKNCGVAPIAARHLSGIVVTRYLICHLDGSDLLLLDGEAVDAEEGSDLVDCVNGELHKQEESCTENYPCDPALWKNVILACTFNLKRFQSGYKILDSNELHLRMIGIRALLAIKRRNHKGLSCLQSKIMRVTEHIMCLQVMRQ